MTDILPLPIEDVRAVSPETAVAFRSLRDAISAAGPLDYKTIELVLIGAFATVGYEEALKIYAARLLRHGVEKAAIRQAALATFAATAGLVNVARALKWIDEAEALLPKA